MSSSNEMLTLIESIRKAHSVSYKLIEKMPQGVNGAWLAIDEAMDEQVILKLVSSNNIVGQIVRSSECSRTLRSKSLPSPRFYRHGFVQGTGSWYVQEYMPGIDAPWPCESLVDQLIVFNQAQAEVAVDEGNNWSENVLSTLFKDTRGWQQKIYSSGNEGVSLVGSVIKACSKFTNYRPISADLVHGDFQHYNAMIYPDGSNTLSAYVDWQDAGCGDRSIDLARLLYDVYVAELECDLPVSETSVAKLTEKIRENSGQAGLVIYLSFWILQVADFGVSCGHDAAAKFFKTGHRILSEILNE